MVYLAVAVALPLLAIATAEYTTLHLSSRRTVGPVSPLSVHYHHHDEHDRLRRRHLLLHYGHRVSVPVLQEHLGTREVHPVPENGYLVYTTLGDVLRKASQGLLWVDDYHPSDKLHSHCRGAREVLVTVSESISWDLDAALRTRGFNASARKVGSRWVVREVGGASRRLLDLLSAIPEVRWIDRRTPFHPLNNIATFTVQSDQHTRPLWDHRLTGEGEVVGVGDTGLDFDSCFFRDDSQDVAFFPKSNPLHRKVLSYDECLSSSDKKFHDDGRSAHGSHVAGSVAGKSLGGMEEYDGLAPGAKIVFSDLSCPEAHGDIYLPPDLTDYYHVARDLGAGVSHNSWGGDAAPQHYGTIDRETDTFMWNHLDYLIVFAAGNSIRQGVLSPAASKNVLTVGAHMNSHNTERRQDLADFSANGPTYDKRIKPEICAPGKDVNSAQSDGKEDSFQCTITSKHGTSMAAPFVSAAAVIIRQYFREGWYPYGSKGTGKPFNASSSLLKAMVLHSARPLSGQQVGRDISKNVPNEFQGWGALALQDVLYLSDTFPSRHLFVEDAIVSQDAVVSFCFEAGEKWGDRLGAKIRVTLVWIDPPPAEGVTQSMINNLDLVVQDASGRLYHANGRSTWDKYNIIEQVDIPAFEKGTYKAMVHGTTVREYHPFHALPFSVVITAPEIKMHPAGGACAMQCPSSDRGVCSGHGQCNGGECKCYAGYHHVDCSECSSEVLCNGHGACSSEDVSLPCKCFGNFTGDHCDQCKPGFYGPSCDGDCKCGEHGECIDGVCRCHDRFGGKHCDQCARGWRTVKGGSGMCDVPSHWCVHNKMTTITGEVRGWLQINDDGNYKNSMECRWRIVAPHPNWDIQLTFREFSIEEIYDTVTVYDNPEIGKRKRLAKYSGTEGEGKVVTARGEVFIEFLADWAGPSNGFAIEFEMVGECIEGLCNGKGSCSSDVPGVPTCLCRTNFDPRTLCLTCVPGFIGDDCSVSGTPSPENTPSPFVDCTGRETDCANATHICKKGECHCLPGFTGLGCNIACPPFDGGASCSNNGRCLVNATTNEGYCLCDGGYRGAACATSSHLPRLFHVQPTVHVVVVEGKWTSVEVDILAAESKTEVAVVLDEFAHSTTATPPVLKVAAWYDESNVGLSDETADVVETKEDGVACVQITGNRERVWIGLHLTDHLQQAHQVQSRSVEAVLVMSSEVGYPKFPQIGVSTCPGWDSFPRPFITGSQLQPHRTAPTPAPTTTTTHFSSYVAIGMAVGVVVGSVSVIARHHLKRRRSFDDLTASEGVS